MNSCTAQTTHSTQNIRINTPPPYLVLRRDKLPTVLSMAGSDSSGGAGIEADVKTITANRCYALTCITALTVQTPVGVADVLETKKDIVEKILDVNLRDMRVDVIKTGMLTHDAIEVLCNKLQTIEKSPVLVVDPVLVATSGYSLARDTMVESIKKLAPHAFLLTPNIYECFKLIGRELEIKTVEDMCRLSHLVKEATGAQNVLVKGGHAPWDTNGAGLVPGSDAGADAYVTDVLLAGNNVTIYRSAYCDTTNTHGTGCTLASAISSNLAHGFSLEAAVYGGIEYVHNCIEIGCDVMAPSIKKNGPVNHVYAVQVPLENMVQDVCYGGHALLTAGTTNTVATTAATTTAATNGKNFFEYLISHPKVKPHWESYVNHEFVRQVATGELPRNKFQFFLEQDYAYLHNYAQIYCLAASKAPRFEDIEAEVAVVSNIKKEMEKHREKMIKHFGITDPSYFTSLTKSEALKRYSRFFLDVAKHGSWEEIVLSLAPCLHGYGEALIRREKEITVAKDDMYYDWCQDYLSPWFREAMDEGVALLDRVAASFDDPEVLVSIFASVCKLETEFWDSALAH